MKKESNLNFSGTAKTFIMPKLQNEVDGELLKMVNFPSIVKQNEALQRRVKKYKTAGIYVEKQVLGIDDIVYTVVPLTVATIQTAHERTKPTTDQEAKMVKDHIESLKKSASFDVIYLSSDDVQSEMEWFLGKFGVPAATNSMKVEQPKEDAFTDEQKEQAKEMFTVKSMTDSEIAEALDVKKSVITKYLKSLKNG